MSEGSVFRTQLIELVREGMTVIDAAGEEVGSVEYMSMGDPGALTPEGNQLQEKHDILSSLGRAWTDERAEPDVDEPVRSRLERLGYLKIDGAGLLDADLYVAADRIARVEGERVFLSVTKDQLKTED